jgi:hypothetical protein
MPPPHNCNKCNILLLDLLDHSLPADYPHKELLRDKARRRIAPLLVHSLKKLIEGCSARDMQKIWNNAIFEAKIAGNINWRTVSNSLTGNLCELSEKWKNEIKFLQDETINAGLIKMKGITYGRATIVVNDWISYCVFLVWTHMHTYHYNHNFPGDKPIPEVFQFHLKLGGIYLNDVPAPPIIHEDELYW